MNDVQMDAIVIVFSNYQDDFTAKINIIRYKGYSPMGPMVITYMGSAGMLFSQMMIKDYDGGYV